MRLIKLMLAVLSLPVLSLPVVAANAGKPVIVATVSMVGDIVREIAGDHADVRVLIGEGIDPHLYKPTRNDVLALSRADIIFYNGLLLEGRMSDALQRLKRSGKPVFAVSDLLAEDRLLLEEDDPSHYDPHIWMDVSLWAAAVDRVAVALISLHPEWQASISTRQQNYQVKLKKLHEYVSQIISTIPDDRRILITAHDAFGYFGRAYGIQVMGIQGLSTESEAGLNDINRLVDLLVDRNIDAIFAETSVADKNVRALIEGARSRGHRVIIGGSLFSDAMGSPGTYEGTYIGMLDHNASTIAKSLGGTVPEGGFRMWVITKGDLHEN